MPDLYLPMLLYLRYIVDIKRPYIVTVPKTLFLIQALPKLFGKACHSMRLFYPHSMAKIQMFSPFFPPMDSMLRAFYWLFL